MVEFKGLQNALYEDAIKAKEKSSVPDPAEVLNHLLSQIEKVDFNELLDVQDGDRKPPQKHYVVQIIEEIKEVAEKNNWGLCRQFDFIYVFNSQYWQVVDKEEVKTFLGIAAAKMGYSEIECKYYEFRDKLYKQFISASNFPAPKPDKEKVLINLCNGTLEISKKGVNLRPFDRRDFITYQLPFDYDTAAKAPIFAKFLNEVLPDHSLQNVLSEFIGYIFSSNLKLEKCLLLYGSGANGKSVFFEIINRLIGDENISNYSLGNLKEEHNRAMIKNKLLNYGSEIRGNIEADVFKQLVSGEPIQARMKYGNPFIMKDYAKLAFNCNTLPKDVEQTNAYFRRFIIVPFSVTIPEEKQDKNLANRIIDSELSGIFNWVLEGLNRVLSQSGFTECQAVKDQLQKYKVQSDSVLQFVDEMEYQRSISSYMSTSDLYQKYKEYCFENGYRAVAKRKFSQRLENAGFDKTRRNGLRGFYIEL